MVTKNKKHKNNHKNLKKIIDKTEKRIIASLIITAILSTSILPLQALTYEDEIEKNKTIIKLTTSLETPSENIKTKIVEIKTAEEAKIAEETRKAEEAERKRKEQEAKKRQRTYTKVYKYVEPTGVGNQDMVNIAKAQVGNIGGQPFWSWYGFNYRVDWCAIFVSWVANQAGLIEDGTIPKFAAVSQGIKFFKDRGLWRDRTYTPRTGDLIFFDWNYNGVIDHVGIVEKVENGRVYTIEGNSNDVCKEKNYASNSSSIYGYGTPNY